MSKAVIVAFLLAGLTACSGGSKTRLGFTIETQTQESYEFMIMKDSHQDYQRLLKEGLEDEK